MTLPLEKCVEAVLSGTGHCAQGACIDYLEEVDTMYILLQRGDAMRLNIQKWGNSAGVRLPAHMLAQMGAKVGDTFEVEVTPLKAEFRLAKPRYSLMDLLAEMPGDELPRVEGWDTMSAVGQEVL